MTLSPEVHQAVTAFAGRRRVLLGVDFDGTLAPFVRDPMDARAAPGGLEAVRAAGALEGVSVVLLSGRDLATLRTLTGIGEDEPIVLVGSHGAQSSLAGDLDGALLDDEQEQTLASVRDGLEQVASDHDGPRVEHKPAGAVLHTRGVAEPVAGRAAEAAHAVAARHTGVHVTPGKDVVEISVLAATKGTALESLATSRRVGAIGYFGDDVTDERAFAVLDPARGDLGVKVGAGETLAEHRVPGIPEVVEALELFVRSRQEQLL